MLKSTALASSIQAQRRFAAPGVNRRSFKYIRRFTKVAVSQAGDCLSSSSSTRRFQRSLPATPGLITVRPAMFAYPATHHFGRTYSSINGGQPTTSKKNVNKENAGALPSKTPSRAGKQMVPSTSMRIGLGVKSTVKDGNVQQSSRDTNGKGNDEGIGERARSPGSDAVD